YLKLTVGQAGVGEGFEVLFIHPALGVFHPSLSPTYPFYQHEGGITRDVLNHKHLARLMDKLVEKAGARDLIVLESSWMSRELFERIRKYSRHGDKILIYSLGEISSLLARSP
ncbi:MAG: tRNA guanosine(15) transglycosylase TgtA, partial [Thermosphaera sp.]